MHAQTCMHQHYSSSERISFLNHVSKTFIDKTGLSDPLKRKDYWSTRSALRLLMVLPGLNIEGSV